jgi:dephospho-CoA kinase
MTTLFGLTGGIGTGKYTVAHLLRTRHGLPVVDADVVAREVVAPGTPALQAIIETFGPGCLQADGSLDRAAMRQRISHDPDARRALEQITHPAIGAEVMQRVALAVASGAALVGVEAALMVETGTWRRYERVVVVTCTPATQLRRVMERDGVTEEAARAIIATQLPLAEKERVAHHLVVNEGSLEDLEAAVAGLVKALAAPAPDRASDPPAPSGG